MLGISSILTTLGTTFISKILTSVTGSAAEVITDKISSITGIPKDDIKADAPIPESFEMTEDIKLAILNLESEAKTEYYNWLTKEMEGARETYVEIATNSEVSWLTRNLPAIVTLLATVATIGITFMILFARLFLDSAVEYEQFVVGALVTATTGTIFNFFFGSSTKDGK